MFSEERRTRIVDLLQKKGRVSVKELADMFQVSMDSIRRDLKILEDQGILQKTHGGAIPISKVRTPASPPLIRYGERSPYDHAIAQLAASYIQERDTVFISGAGMHYVILKYLPEDMPITVVTNSIKIADTLQEREHIDVYLLGGKVKPSGEICDVLANEFVSQFSIDIGFLTGGGISASGITLSTPETASLLRTVSKVSRRNICLAPHYKMGMNFFVKALSIEENNLIITDEETTIEEIEKIESKGVEVVIAKVDSI